jgi:hypothetical protein
MIYDPVHGYLFPEFDTGWQKNRLELFVAMQIISGFYSCVVSYRDLNTVTRVDQQGATGEKGEYIYGNTEQVPHGRALGFVQCFHK